MNVELHQQYRVMFENMAQGAFYQLADGSLVDVNPAALEMFGLTREQFMGRTSYDAAWRVIKEDGADLSPDQHPSIVALRTGQQVRDVIAGVFNPAKKTYVWMTINAIPMFREGDSSPYQVFVTLHDITAQKRLNDIHLQTTRQYDVLTNTSTDGYWVVDGTGRIIAVNDTICRMYGYSSEELLTKSLRDFDALENDEEMQGHISRIITEGYDRFETLHIRKDGSVVDVEVSTAYIPESGIFLAFIRDITEHKQNEEALKESELKFRTLFTTIQDAIFLTTTDGKIVECNEKLSGYSRNELLGSTTVELGLWANVHERQQVVDKVTTEGYVNDFEATFRRKDGTLFSASISTNAFPMGDTTYLLSVVRDITERKQAEDEVRRLNADLHQLIAERTTELTQTNRDLSSFCYAISHELRAPVARLKGLSQALREDFAEDPATAAHCAERIVVASDQLQQVIDSVLQLTRLSHVSFTRQPINVSGLAREIVNELLIDASERVKVVIADDLAASADLQLVRLCLANLIGNALKYSAGQPVARIEIGRDDASGALFVRDNGVGFDMAHADKIFEPFVRLHSEAEFAGTGIGLATVQRIIERHGGRIWAEAAPGVGATFFFTLGPVREKPA